MSVTAPDVDGYRFLCWGIVSCQGGLGVVSVQSATNKTSNFWTVVDVGFPDRDGNCTAVALYIRE